MANTPITQFQLVSLQELENSPYWDHSKDNMEYNKTNLINQALTMSSTEIDFVCAGKLANDWDTIKDNDNVEVNNIKNACCLQTMFLLRNGTEYIKQVSQSFSAGTISMNATNPADQLMITPEAYMYLNNTSYLVQSAGFNLYDGLRNGQHPFGFHDDQQQWEKDADKKYINKQGLYSSDSTVSINTDGQAEADDGTKQVDLTVNFNNPTFRSSLKDVIMNDPNISKHLKGDKGDVAKFKSIVVNTDQKGDIVNIDWAIEDDQNNIFKGQTDPITIPSGKAGVGILKTQISTESTQLDNGDTKVVITSTITYTDGNTEVSKSDPFIVKRGATGTVENIDSVDLSNNKTVKPLIKQVGDLDTYVKEVPYVDLDGSTITDNLHDLFYEDLPKDFKTLKDGKVDALNKGTKLNTTYFGNLGADNSILVKNLYSTDLTTSAKDGVNAINELNSGKMNGLTSNNIYSNKLEPSYYTVGVNSRTVYAINLWNNSKSIDLIDYSKGLIDNRNIDMNLELMDSDGNKIKFAGEKE